MCSARRLARAFSADIRKPYDPFAAILPQFKIRANPKQRFNPTAPPFTV
jgi:hypothetical protein